MEDDNGLELSLGLSFGGLAAKSKGKIGSSSDAKAEEDDRGNKIDDFKNFLNGGNQKQDSGTGSQRSDSVKPQEKFFNDLSRANADADTSMDLNSRALWFTNSRHEIEEAKRPDTSNKRKMLFDDMNNKKKHEREAHPADLQDKTKTSYISITMEEGSTAENEDVAESEIEGSTSRLVSHHDDSSKQYVGVAGASEVPKDFHGFSNSNIVNLQGQKRFNSSSENEFKLGKMTYGVPFSAQSLNIMNIPYTISMKESNSSGVPGSSGHPLPGIVQKVPTATNERQGAQSLNPGNLPVMFGYSPVQLPMFEKDNSWGLVSQSQQLHPSYTGRGLPNSDKQSDGSKISQATLQFDGKTIEWAKGEGKQHGTEEGSSTQAEEDGKVSGMNNRAKDASECTNGITLDFSAIKPGIEADLKFGGCGSYPDLPWVSAKGSGPNGRTISGVTYRYSANQNKIVCACHGWHMSPEEFVRHANDELSNPEGGAGLLTFSSSNPAASTQN
ncbi:ninja-family protein mc410-like [Mangifera indica]|uniref:ninja-family protein mc410-like n=1 Tax=Mangifera indica TaxID=29780 RepID=UPI001CFC3D5D|nr:ninja-family protein mc410-like [Mangifera indica]XP_044464182.1 ninja-family protein mc410-like [Mangifera indica]